MATSEELARFHVETAIKLTSKAFVASLLASATAPVVTAPVVTAPVVTAPATVPPPTDAAPKPAAGHRGRKPGAAPDTERCEWTLVAGDRCKNRRLETGSFCKIHSSKIHLIDPASTD